MNQVCDTGLTKRNYLCVQLNMVNYDPSDYLGLNNRAFSRKTVQKYINFRFTNHA